MGTRSVTFVYDGNEDKATAPLPIICMYRQMDGYPEGHGLELATFLAGITMVNGISSYDEPIANGAPCLAAQIVKQFKEGPGGIYLQVPREDIDADQEYTYKVIATAPHWDHKVKLKVGIVLEIWKNGYQTKPKLLKKGTPAQVEAWIEKQKEKA